MGAYGHERYGVIGGRHESIVTGDAIVCQRPACLPGSNVVQQSCAAHARLEGELDDALGLLQVHEVVVGPLVRDVRDADLARPFVDPTRSSASEGTVRSQAIASALRASNSERSDSISRVR